MLSRRLDSRHSAISLNYLRLSGQSVTIPPGSEGETAALMAKYKINAFASQMVPLERAYPDLRDAK